MEIPTQYKCKSENMAHIEQMLCIVFIHFSAAEKDEPYFYLKPKSLVAARYNPAMLHCVILGVPQPSTKWFHNNISIVNNTHRSIFTNGSLHFKFVQLNDVGNYFCEGENIHGSITSYPPVPLFVTYIDFKFLESPSSQKVISGYPFMLNCVAPNSYPKKLNIAWYFNYTPLDLKDRKSVVFYNNGSIVFLKADLQNQGSYFCEAVNPISPFISRTSKLAFVTVYVKPNLMKDHKVLEVGLGDSINIYCNASGIPQPNTTLYKQANSSWKLISRNGIHYFSNVTRMNDGVYKCVSMNEVGVDEFVFHLDVQYTPSIISSLRNISMNVDSDLNLSCNAIGNPSPTFHWMFHDYNGRRSLESFSENCSLLLIKVSDKNEGFFNVTAVNKVGNHSSSFFLKVLYPPAITNLIGSSSVINGEDISYKCISTGDPRPTIQWSFNKISISKSENAYTRNDFRRRNKTFESTSVLTIRNVSLANQGLYTCESTNKLAQVVQDVNIFVQVHPVIEQFLIDGVFSLNNSIDIHCSTYGIPTPQIFLYHNSSQLSHRDGATNRFHVNATISNVQLNDGGEYKCCSVNSLGSICRVQFIEIAVPPYQITHINISGVSKRSVNISWKIPFNGNSDILFFRLIVNSSTMDINKSVDHYELSFLKPYTNYSIQVASVNQVGMGKLSKPVYATTLQAAPSRPLNVTILSKQSNSVTVKWCAPLQRNGVIQLYRISAESPSQHFYYNITAQSEYEYVYEIRMLTPYSKYWIKISAATIENRKYLFSKWSQELVAFTLKDVPDITVEYIHIVNVTWKSALIKYMLSEDLSLLHGDFKGFQIKITSQKNTLVFVTNNTFYILNNLSAYQQYNVSVSVINDVGVSQFNRQVNFTTSQHVPGVVHSITVTQVNSSVVECSWQAPLVTNGIILDYRIKVFNERYEELRSARVLTTKIIFTNLVTNRTYIFQISARTIAGYGDKTEKKSFLKNLQTMKKPEAVSAKTWLEREYLVVVVGVSCFAAILLLILFILIICKCRSDNSDAKEKVQPLEMSTSPRRRTNSSLNDLIWDSSSNDNFFMSPSQPSVHYESVKAPTPPVAPVHRKQKTAEGNKKTTKNKNIENSRKEKRSETSDNVCHDNNNKSDEVFRYQSVDPYQGRTVEMSPLVKLKGKERKQLHLNADEFFIESNINNGFSCDDDIQLNNNTYSSLRHEKPVVDDTNSSLNISNESLKVH